MPGHKGRLADLNWFDYDLTEIPGADNLHDAHGIIDQVQKKLADVFGSRYSAILINGSTVGIQSAILSTCHPGDELLVALNCHRSVFGALALGRLKGCFIKPEFEKEWGFASKITPVSVAEACRLYPAAKGMVLVNPTYYGTVSDLKAIADILHAQGKFLIVDEAHGAQFHFSSVFPQTALQAGSDIVIQSTHKVLGSLTQSALIHGQGSLINWNRLKMFLALLQSSSPSYPLMISVEEAVDRSLEKASLVFAKTRESHHQFCQKQTGKEMIQLYDGSKNPLGYDYTKWLFSSGQLKGTELEKILVDRFKIQCEMSDRQNILAMTGLETRAGDLDKLLTAVQVLNQELGERKDQQKNLGFEGLADDLSLAMPIWQGLWSEKKEKLALKSSFNRILADFIIPYPPGIPVLLPGCRMTERKLQILQRMIADGIVIVGVNDKKEVLVIAEDDYE